MYKKKLLTEGRRRVRASKMRRQQLSTVRNNGGLTPDIELYVRRRYLEKRVQQAAIRGEIDEAAVEELSMLWCSDGIRNGPALTNVYHSISKHGFEPCTSLLESQTKTTAFKVLKREDFVTSLDDFKVEEKPLIVKKYPKE